MTPVGTDRRRQLVTAGIGTVLMLVMMGTVLLFGFRIATHMRANISALRAISRPRICAARARRHSLETAPSRNVGWARPAPRV